MFDRSFPFVKKDLSSFHNSGCLLYSKLLFSVFVSSSFFFFFKQDDLKSIAFISIVRLTGLKQERKPRNKSDSTQQRRTFFFLNFRIKHIRSKISFEIWLIMDYKSSPKELERRGNISSKYIRFLNIPFLRNV